MIENRLAILLAKKRIDSRELVKLTGLDNHTVRKLVYGNTTRIEIKTLDLLCFALECNVNDIFKYVPDN